jgi:hypothetical protein
VESSAPEAVAIELGHDGWVVGDEPAVMIESISSATRCGGWGCQWNTRTKRQAR